MKDSNKLYYLDRHIDSKRNIPDDTHFKLLHIAGYGTSMTTTIGSCEHNNVWIDKYTGEVVHPYAYSYMPKFTPEDDEQGKD